MRLEGIHHLTAITGDAQCNLDFRIDEPAESLGEELELPGRHEHMRERLEQTLIPLRKNPRTSAASR